MPLKLFLLRHAQPESGGDVPLSRVGQIQAEKLGDMFRRLSLPGNTSFIASELLRAHQTASIISERMQVGQIRPEPSQIRPIPPPVGDLEADAARFLTELQEGAKKNVIAVWHSPSIGKVLNSITGNNLLEWPHGATAHITCRNSFGAGTGTLRWFILPELLP